jgi:NADH dehydrogenase [ubiquinone] 1 alpha subcomplex assembly factor 7
VHGDFVTAPEISQMFGELLGLWCAQVWRDQGMPERPHLVELGPGRGTLLADALRALKLVPGFLDALRVTLIEASPALTSIQQETLKGLKPPIAWLTRFDPAAIDGPLYLLANEFFDALPIRQFVKSEEGWHERVIVSDAIGALSFALAPASANAFVPADRSPAPDGAVYESCVSAAAIVEEIAGAIERRGGGALIVD